jgi:soluble lytic murein transglycosylase-like protein
MEYGLPRFSSRALIAVAALLVPVAASATCWEEAGQWYGIDPLLLKAIAWKESRGWTGAVGPKLPDGNRALGVMQINTIHLPVLSQYGIRREDLFDACTSQKVGAWVLADCIQRFGATWKAVGCYYAGPASKNVAAQVEYVMDVQRYYDGYRRQAQEHSTASAQVASYQGD